MMSIIAGLRKYCFAIGPRDALQQSSFRLLLNKGLQPTVRHHTLFIYFLRAFIYFLRGTDQGVESVHDFFYTRRFSTLYFDENIQYLNDICV